jgi:transcriptional regulator with XRE-family HTH domain
MAHSTPDWERLGRAIVRRRVELGFNTQAGLAEHMGLTARILGDLEGGKRVSYGKSTLARLERALDWPPGTVDEVLAGGDGPQRHTFSPTAPTLLHPLAARLHQLLAEDSPLPAHDRAMLEQLMEHVLDAEYAKVVRRNRS